MIYKKSILSLALVSSMAFSSAQAADGTININGEIIASACEIKAGDNNKTISLGTISSNAFNGAGTEASSALFSINVEKCAEAIKNARIVFDGDRDTSDHSLLGVTGGATGVAIALYDQNDGSPVPLGVASKPVALNGDNATLNFIARYKATAATVGAGKADGVTQFTVQYQ